MSNISLLNSLNTDSFIYKKISDVCEFVQGFAFKNNTFKEDGVGLVRTTNIQDYAISKDNMVFIDSNDYKEDLSKYIVKKDSILIGMSGTIKVGINKTEEEYYLNQRVGMFIIKNDQELDRDYLLHILINSVSKFYELVSGSSVKNLSSKEIMNFKIPIPPIQKQREISDFLNHFLDLSSLLNDEANYRKRQYNLICQKVLNDKCDFINLGSICRVITKGTTPSKFTDSGVTFIKTEAIDGNNIDLSKLSYIDKNTHLTSLKRSILEENDILFTIAGATIGKMVVVTKNLLPANTNQALAIIRLNENININYVKHILKSDYMKKYIKTCVKGSAQPNLNLQQLNDFSFPFPSSDVQNEIVKILDLFDDLISNPTYGIIAEKNNRNQQYEYYRKKLCEIKEEI